jgi:ABC-type transport system involved in cytochrome c biogenesis permease subunit
MSLQAGMTAHPLVVAVCALHLGALVLSGSGALLGKRLLLRTGLVLLATAFALNTWILADRWIEAGRPPFKTLFETLLFYPWCVAAVTLAFVLLHGLHAIVPFAAGVSAFGLGYALWKPDAEIVLLPPALQSAWFVPHVITYFLAYAALFLSAVLAGLALFSRREGLEAHAHRSAVFGVGALSIGLFLGGVWAKYAWGDWWSWDPKENWALATWIAYMLYLHLRLLDGWAGRRAMWTLLVSFAAVVFTYLGMSLLPTVEGSLHAYR